MWTDKDVFCLSVYFLLISFTALVLTGDAHRNEPETKYNVARCCVRRGESVNEIRFLERKKPGRKWAIGRRLPR